MGRKSVDVMYMCRKRNNQNFRGIEYFKQEIQLHIA